jgi:hypothetical protein
LVRVASAATATKLLRRERRDRVDVGGRREAALSTTE